MGRQGAAVDGRIKIELTLELLQGLRCMLTIPF